MSDPASARPCMLTLEEARELGPLFAPWVQDLGLRVEAVERGFVRLRLPHNDRLTRIGGILSGQAMMAVADTAMVYCIRSALEVDADIATVQQSTNFFRGVAQSDLICEVRLTKEGRTMMFGDCVMYADGQPEKPAVQATLVYAVIPRR